MRKLNSKLMKNNFKKNTAIVINIIYQNIQKKNYLSRWLTYNLLLILTSYKLILFTKLIIRKIIIKMMNKIWMIKHRKN